MEAGYAGTPLVRKLGIREGDRVALLAAPAGFEALLALPDGVQVARRVGPADVVVAFFTSRTALRERMDALGRAIFPDGGCWVAWPKRASGVETDLTEDAIREVALPIGLVDNKVCAIDATWSGLRLAWRRELRGGQVPTRTA